MNNTDSKCSHEQLAMTRPHLLPPAQSEPEIGFMGGRGDKVSRGITIKQPNLRFSSLELNVHYSKGSRLVLFQPQLLRELSQRRAGCQPKLLQLQLLISPPPKNCNLLFSPRDALELSCPLRLTNQYGAVQCCSVTHVVNSAQCIGPHMPWYWLSSN